MKVNGKYRTRNGKWEISNHGPGGIMRLMFHEKIDSKLAQTHTIKVLSFADLLDLCDLVKAAAGDLEWIVEEEEDENS